MSLRKMTLVVGVGCDVRDCAAELIQTAPASLFSEETRAFICSVLAVGWAERIGRSNRWYCPAHADRAGRCVKGAWGQCSRHCPVHGHGQVITWAGEDAKRLAGQRSLLAEASR